MKIGMHRVLLRACCMKQDLGSPVRHTKTCSILLKRSVMKGRSQVTYSQWQYLKKFVIGEKRIENNFSSIGGGLQATNSLIRGQGQLPETVDNVFEHYHSLLGNGLFTPESIVDFSCVLFSAVYSDLERLPWLHRNDPVRAFIQLVLNKKNNTLLTKSLHCHRHFPSIYNHIDHNLDEIQDIDCCLILFNLIHCGLDVKDPLVTKLYCKCLGATPDFGIEQIKHAASIFQVFGRRDFYLVEKCLCQLDHILSSLSVREINDLMVTVPHLTGLMSKELVYRCVNIVLKYIEEEKSALDGNVIGNFLHFACKVIHLIDSDTAEELKRQGKMVLNQFPDFDKLQSHQIRLISRNAERLGCLTDTVTGNLQARSTELLHSKRGSLYLPEITELALAFVQKPSPAHKKEVCELFMDHIYEADVMTISNMAEIMVDLHLYDSRLVTLFQQKVLLLFDNLSQFITRFSRVLEYLTYTLEHDAEFNAKLCDRLLWLLDRQQGFDPVFSAMIAHFILRSSNDSIPAKVLSSLEDTIPRVKISALLLVVKGLEGTRKPRSRLWHNQVLEIWSIISETYDQHLRNADSASALALLLKSICSHKNIDLNQLGQVLDHFPRFTKTMSTADYLQVVSALSQSLNAFYLPEVFEDLIAFAKEHYKKKDLQCSGVDYLLRVLSRSGYRPENFEDFSIFVLQVLKEMMRTTDSYKHVGVCYNLSLMQIFSDEALERIFSFDYLQEVERSLEGDSVQLGKLQYVLMFLNRSVTLECPHLDLPWFLGQQYRQWMDGAGDRVFQENKAFVEEVKSVLQAVTGGEEFIQHKVFSPYFHPIDFQVVLDSAGDPINSAGVACLEPFEQGYERLAILLVDKKQRCINSYRRNGHFLHNCHHLEILGYRVVEITIFDWNSMALADWNDKVAFVCKKLGKTSSKDPSTLPSAGSSTPSSGPSMHPYWK